MAEKIIKLLIISLVFGQIIRLPFTPIDFLAILLLPFWIGSLSRSKLARPIIIFTSIGFFSLLLNSKDLLPLEFLTSFFYSLRFFILAGIYFVIRRFEQKVKERLLYWLAGSGIIIAILGLVQYFLYPDLRNLYYAGWDEHLYRVFSTFLDPNFAGAFFVLTLILLVGLAFHSFNPILILGSVLTFIAFLLTYSRSAFLMFIVGMILLLLLLGKKKIMLFLLGLLIVGVIFLPKNLPSEGVNLYRTASILAREESARNALTIFEDNPLFGVGFNAYRYAQKRYAFLKEENWQDTHSGAGTDNSFLFVLATTGIVGFLSFIFLWSKILKLAFVQKKKLISKIVIASCFALFINSFFVNSLFYESILVWMWVLMGIMESK